MITENTVTLLGRLGRDAEVRATRDGTPVASLSMATDRPARDQDNRKSDWHSVVIWEPHQVVQLAKKGDWVLVSRASLQYETWEDKDGNTRRSAEVVAGRGARVVVIGQLPAGTRLGLAGDMEHPAAAPAAAGPDPPRVDAEDEDLPF